MYDVTKRMKIHHPPKPGAPGGLSFVLVEPPVKKERERGRPRSGRNVWQDKWREKTRHNSASLNEVKQIHHHHHQRGLLRTNGNATHRMASRASVHGAITLRRGRCARSASGAAAAVPLTRAFTVSSDPNGERWCSRRAVTA